MSKKLIAFDLDGTLVNSKTDIANALNWTLGRYGIKELPENVVAKYVGTGVLPLIHETLRVNGLDTFAEATAKFQDRYFEHLADHTRLYEGTTEVLEALSDYKKVVLTNKSNRFAVPLLKLIGAETYFERCYGRESFPTSKPDAGPLLAIAKEFGLAPAELVMVGDTDVDLRAGKAAGTQTVAVTYGFGDPTVLRSLRPDFVAHRPQDLLEFLLRD